MSGAIKGLETPMRRFVQQRRPSRGLTLAYDQVSCLSPDLLRQETATLRAERLYLRGRRAVNVVPESSEETFMLPLCATTICFVM
jgi:hypothetical protein